MHKPLPLRYATHTHTHGVPYKEGCLPIVYTGVMNPIANVPGIIGPLLGVLFLVSWRFLL